MDRQIQSAPQSLRGRLFQPGGGRRKEQRILVLETGLAGVPFHIESEAEQARLDALKPGDELLLFRESDNAYDAWAIAVYATQEDKLGYVTRFKNETIARLMDAGKKFVAAFDDPKAVAERIAERGDDPRWRQADTELMKFPFSIYMVETE